MTQQTEAVLSLNSDRWIRAGAVSMMLVVATASAILSWNGLTYLAVMSGIPSEIAWLLAVAIDGSIILGSFETVHAILTNRSPFYGWLLTGVGVVLSIYGNVASSTELGLQSAFVHAIAPTVLFLSVEGLVRILKFRITETQEAVEEAKRRAEKEARRREKAEEQAQRKSVKTTKVAEAPSRTSSTNGKASENDAEVARYREIMDFLPSDSTKASRIEAVLREHPEARNVHLALALGMNIKAIATTIGRVRDRLSKEKAEGERFQEIVKDLAPVGE